jgi:hypothetical protein
MFVSKWWNKHPKLTYESSFWYASNINKWIIIYINIQVIILIHISYIKNTNHHFDTHIQNKHTNHHFDTHIQYKHTNHHHFDTHIQYKHTNHHFIGCVYENDDLYHLYSICVSKWWFVCLYWMCVSKCWFVSSILDVYTHPILTYESSFWYTHPI